MTNARWTLRDAEQMLPWTTCFRRGVIWNHPGRWELTSRDSQGAVNLGTLAEWLQSSTGNSQSEVHDLRLEEVEGQVRLTASGQLLPMVLAELGRHPEVALSHELQLLMRIEHLAAVMVDEKDVMAFAAPSGVTNEEVVAVCEELGIPDEGTIGRWTSQGLFSAAWLPTLVKAEQRALRRLFVSEAAGFAYGEQVCGGGSHGAVKANGRGDFARPAEAKSASASSPESGAAWTAAELWVDVWLWTCINQFVRQSIVKSEEDAEAPIPSGPSYRIMYRGEVEVLGDWESALINDKSEFQADGWLIWRTLKQAFQSAGWSREGLHDQSGRAFYHLEFELVPPPPGVGGTSWVLEYWLAHNNWPIRERLHSWWQQPSREWLVGRDLLREPDTWFLPKLAEAGAVVPAIAESLMEPKPDGARIRAEDVYDFLTSDLILLEEIGCRIQVPSIQKMAETDIRIRVEVQHKANRSTRGGIHGHSSSNGWFDTRQLVEFDWKIALGDSELSAKEFEQMVAERSPLVQLGGSWKLVPLNAVLARLADLRKSAEHIMDGSFMDVARLVMLADQEEAAAVPVEIDFADDVRDVEELVRSLLAASRPKRIAPPASFKGTLRNYQQLGFEWLLHLRSIGCGGVLADDMGLGKTIQILAYWGYLWENRLADCPHLLVCPTSLLQNWRAELAKFTPDLRVYVHHGSTRITDVQQLVQTVADYNVVMTTYATAVRDAEALTTMTWDSVVVDEAQNVKNPDTKQAQVVCQLQASQRIALTGTPVENRLEELWSIFRFAVPGYLGGLTWFRRQYVDPIVSQNVPNASRRLHQLLQPVLMRRSKTDPAIQLELPEKWEVCEYAGLTSEQGALYQSIVNRLFLDIEGRISGMSRRGQILTALVRLKQICDHPCLSVGGSASASRSGKLKLLLDLLDDAISEGEAALVFTQFRGMGEILCEAIEQRFGSRPQFLHGGLTAAARGEMVDAFQSGRDVSRVLVLSLKAGGVGLNLTRANHVFHYDRWWNPAVEDQATDRVFRIGQTRNVQVHKLVCPGTLEERIDELIRTKRSLSSVVVGESEGWLTEMDNQTLRTLFELDLVSAVEEGDDW